MINSAVSENFPFNKSTVATVIVVCVFIDNDVLRHSGQNIVGS